MGHGQFMSPLLNDDPCLREIPGQALVAGQQVNFLGDALHLAGEVFVEQDEGIEELGAHRPIDRARRFAGFGDKGLGEKGYGVVDGKG